MQGTTASAMAGEGLGAQLQGTAASIGLFATGADALQGHQHGSAAGATAQHCSGPDAVVRGPSVAPEEVPRLKRPLLSNASAGARKVRVVKPAQRKGFVRTNTGAKRATIIGSSSPISTLAEVKLFNQLLPLHTRGSRTNWDSMARDFNAEVLTQLTQQQKPGSQGNTLAPKTAPALAKFDRIMAQEFCLRDAAGMMEALANTPLQAASRLPVGGREVVGIMLELVANYNKPSTPHHQNTQQVETARAGAFAVHDAVPGAGRGGGGSNDNDDEGRSLIRTADGSGSPQVGSKRKLAACDSRSIKKAKTKCNKQGEGVKSCRACGMSGPFPDGLQQHRMGCAAYIAKHKK
jgi:hypothetical protein